MKFSIRDLLWLTLLAAVAAGWWVDHVRLNEKLEGALSPGPKLVPAEGNVTLRGQPLADAFVTVVYPDGNCAVGFTDSQGAFTLTYSGWVGARPGTKLTVLVTKHQPLDEGIGGTPTSPKNILPGRYSTVTISPLRLDLPAGESKSLAIDLQ